MSDKGLLPAHSSACPLYRDSIGKRRSRTIFLYKAVLLLASVSIVALWTTQSIFNSRGSPLHRVPQNAAIIEKCRALRLTAGPPEDFASRVQSDRFVTGTPSTLLKNATVWTGNDNGYEVLQHVDILLAEGLIQRVGKISESHLQHLRPHLKIRHLKGAWVTPGIVDMHSHIGDAPSPALKGTARDDNSLKGPVLPWLRSLDGLNTHDESFALSIAGGVTTSLVLPGSANAIGGQAFPIKLRPTLERSPTAKLIEIPDTLNGTGSRSPKPVWRHMKHACGENPDRVYGNSRMDTYWAFREAYNKAAQLMNDQDEFCRKADANLHGVESFPEDLKWEALVDVLRGRVKIHTHCYETVDLDAIVRLTNEFKFPIAAFHHAHEAYLGVDIIKRAYGQPPAIAIFATNARYKREAYRGSEFAAKILSESGLSVAMKSDHPVLDSRYLLYEAQQAHYYGLAGHFALSAVTSTPARVLALDHRIGFIRPKFDADLVVWDSHPLALGATPLQVYIDGISQLAQPTSSLKPAAFQAPPVVPDFSGEAEAALKYDGLPPLAPKKLSRVLFINVAGVMSRHISDKLKIRRLNGRRISVLVLDGEVVCADARESCAKLVSEGDETAIIDLDGGHLSPGLTVYGPNAGLEEIAAEASTNDGTVLDPINDRIPDILGGSDMMIRAADGLRFGGRDLQLAYAAGVTTAVVSPSHESFMSGLGTAFSIASKHKLERGAVIEQVTAVHVALSYAFKPSVSSQIAVLRRLLSQKSAGESGKWFDMVANGEIPLVIEVESADIIASILSLKAELENASGTFLKITLAGATEAHLLAQELGRAGVGVILKPARAFPGTWEKTQLLSGPPITKDGPVALLMANNVTVGIGVEELWSSRNVRFDIAWAAIDGHGKLSKEQAIALASSNLNTLLGVSKGNDDLVATTRGDLLSLESKVVAVISRRRGTTDVMLT